VARILSVSPGELVVEAAALSPSEDQPGTGDVVLVSKALGELQLNRAYEYLPPPHVSHVSGAAGPHHGGNQVVLRGAHLCREDGQGSDASLTLAGVQAKVIKCTPRALFAVAGALEAGTTRGLTRALVLHSEAYGTIRLPRAYRYRAAPQVTNIMPRSGMAAGGNRVHIVGSSLSGGPSAIGEHVRVRFGQKEAMVLKYSPGSVEVEAPASTSAGCVSITVESRLQGQGLSGGRQYCYYPRPQIVALQPAQGKVDGGTHIKVLGSHLHNGDVTEVWIGQHRAELLQVAGDGEVVVRAPEFDKEDMEQTLPVVVRSKSRGDASYAQGPAGAAAGL
jgi:hypothetical protein